MTVFPAGIEAITVGRARKTVFDGTWESDLVSSAVSTWHRGLPSSGIVLEWESIS